VKKKYLNTSENLSPIFTIEIFPESSPEKLRLLHSPENINNYFLFKTAER